MRRCVPAGVLLFLLGVGCAARGLRLGPAQQAVRQGEYQRSLELLDRHPAPTDVLWQMERGLCLRLIGRWAESSRALATARERQDELYTRSVSNEALALAVNDLLRPYRAAPFELPFLDLYSAFNYLDQGDLDGGLVEARALSLGLEMRRTEDDDARQDWGLGRLFAGLVLEAGGEWNDAWVAYQAADSAYASSGATQNGSIREIIQGGLERTAVRCGLITGVVDDRAGHLVLWVEEGTAPVKREMRIHVPIFKDEEDRDWHDRSDWDETLGRRTLEWRGRTRHHQAAEVAYWLEVALPVFDPPSPAPPFHFLAEIDGADSGMVFEAEDVEVLARTELERRYPGIAARAAGRAIAKGLATRAAHKRSGELAGTVANLIGVVTERADTRSWTSLPARVGLAVLDVQSGWRHLVVHDPSGGTTTAVDEEIEIPEGGWRFFACRLPPRVEGN